jgi:uncharacterized protein YggE
MNLRTRSFLPILVPLFLIALLVPAAAQALERTVSASAEARLKVRNDTARTGFLVAVERRSRGAALEGASRRMRGVLAAVGHVPGVGAGDVSTGRVSVETVRHKGKTTYRATERVLVVLHQPKTAGVLVEAALAAGASGVNGPVYFVAEPERAFTKVLAAAFDRAKARAGTLAAQAGATLGPVLAIDEGEGPTFALEDEDTTSKGFAGAHPPVRPGSSTVNAYVHVIFALQ